MRLLRRIRNQKLQILLVKNPKVAAAGGDSGAIERRIDADIAKDPQIVEWTSQLAELQASINEQRMLSRHGGRSLGQLKQQAARLENQLAERQAELASGSSPRPAGGSPDVSTIPGGSAGSLARLEANAPCCRSTRELATKTSQGPWMSIKNSTPKRPIWRIVKPSWMT